MLIPTINSGESLVSYSYRVSKANFYASTQSLASGWKLNILQFNRNSFTDKSINAIHEVTGISKKRLHLMNESSLIEVFGVEFYDLYVIRNQFKYCPVCICESRYHKLFWMLEPVTCCLKHKCFLRDSCSMCHARISIRGLMTNFCDECGHLFSARDSINVSDRFLLQTQRIIQNQLLKNKPIIVSDDTVMSLNDFLIFSRVASHLLQGMNSYVGDYRVMEPLYKKNSALDNQMSCYKYANVFWLLNNFPSNFNEMLEKYVELPLKVRGYKNVRIQHLSNGSSCVIGLLSKTNLFENANKPSMTSLKSLIICEIPKRRENFKKPNCAVKENIIEGEQIASENLITRTEAASILGISGKVQINKLIDAGYFALRKYPQNCWYLNKAEVCSFLESIRGECDPNKSGVSFYKALLKLSKYGLDLVGTINIIRSNKLRAFVTKQHGKLSDIIFDPVDMEQCMQMLKDNRKVTKGLTKAEVLYILKLDYRSLMLLEQRQLLVPHYELFYKSKKRRINYYSQEQVEDFKRKYIDVREVSDQFGISIVKIRGLIRKGIIQDALKGITKRYLFEVDEIQPILENLRTE